jgi:MFS transporter, PHS family, inorganic phosphate transporter
MQDNVMPGRLPLPYEAAIISSLLCGAVVGNILGGSLADVYGRKFLFEVACAILTAIAFMSAFSFGTSGPAVVGSLAFWRFFLGIGIGAMYPLSAIIMSEYSTRKSRGAFIAFVFAMQGQLKDIRNHTYGFTNGSHVTHLLLLISGGGILLAGAVVAIANSGVRMLSPSNDFPIAGIYKFGCAAGTAYTGCTALQKSMYEEAVMGSTPDTVEYVWRSTVAVGALPALVALLLSVFLLVETPRFTAHVKKDHLLTILDLASQGEPYAALVASTIDTDGVLAYAEPDISCCGFLYFHGWNLIATSVCWFLFNTAFYGLVSEAHEFRTDHFPIITHLHSDSCLT